MEMRDIAHQALDAMQRQGFDHAQVAVELDARDEVNLAHNEASLFRSTESRSLTLTGIVDARKATVQTTDFDDIGGLVAQLHEDAQAAPADEANAVSSAEQIEIVQGPQEANLDGLADKVRELIEFRGSETPTLALEEGYAAYQLAKSLVLTSGGSDLSASVGSYSLTAMGTAKEGTATSSFNYAGGDCDEFGSAHASELFGIGEMMRETTQQIHTRGLDDKFAGDVVLSPHAVSDLLGWLQSQVGDMHLIAGSSIYRERVGETIAAPSLSIRSRFDGPGLAAITGDGFVAKPITLLDQGRLETLLPSLYGSRKTGLQHTPSLGSGWEILPGEEARDELIAGVSRGALVGRLSMGSPAANGDFSGVIKNSFRIDGGARGQALSETMINGNMAQMLKDIVGISRERLDSGSSSLPWIRITNLNFS